MGRIIAVANQKGGVGKTTTAVNLAASLAVAEQRVLLIDLDPQGNATSGMGIDSTTLSGSVYDLLLDRKPISDLTIRPQIPGFGASTPEDPDGGRSPQFPLSEKSLRTPVLDLLPAHRDLAGVEVEFVGMAGRETILKTRLAAVIDTYDFLVIDCPPSLGLLTINALTAAHSLLIPMQCEYYAMEGLKQLLQTLARVRRSLNPRLSILGILLTLFDGRNNLNQQVAEQVRTVFKEQVFKGAIPRNVTLAEAPSHGKPVLFYDAVSRGAQAYLALAQEVLERAA